FFPSTVSTEAQIQVSYPNLPTEELKLQILPSTPKKIYFKQLISKYFAITEPTDIEIEVEMVDEFNNRIIRSINDISLQISDPEKVTLLTPQINLVNGLGKAKIRLTPDTFGAVYLTATKDNL